MNPDQAMYGVVAMVLNELTDEELAAFNICAQLDMSPHGRVFDYDKVKSLYTPDLHDVTKGAIAAYVNTRFK